METIEVRRAPILRLDYPKSEMVAINYKKTPLAISIALWVADGDVGISIRDL